MRACSVAQLGPALCDSRDCRPLGSSVLGISEAKMLEWLAISSSEGHSQPRDRTCISCIYCIGRHIFFFATEPPGKPSHDVEVILKNRKRERQEERGAEMLLTHADF